MPLSRTGRPQRANEQTRTSAPRFRLIFVHQKERAVRGFVSIVNPILIVSQDRRLRGNRSPEIFRDFEQCSKRRLTFGLREALRILLGIGRFRVAMPGRRFKPRAEIFHDPSKKRATELIRIVDTNSNRPAIVLAADREGRRAAVFKWAFTAGRSEGIARLATSPGRSPFPRLCHVARQSQRRDRFEVKMSGASFGQ